MPGPAWGWLWIATGSLLTLIDPVLGLVRIEALSHHFPTALGLLALVYGAIIVIYHRRRRTALKLSPADLEEHGAALERSVPMIMDLLARKVSVKEIARILKAQESLPEEITYKYVIALGRELATRHADGPTTAK